MIYFVTHHDQSYTIANVVSDSRERREADLRLLNYRALFTHRVAPVGHYIFTDFDRLTAYEVQVAATIARRVQEVAPAAQILNRPAEVLERYPLLRRLAREGLNDFSAYRVDSDEMPRRYPVFIRSEDDCHKPDTGLLQSETELLAAIDRLRAAGIPMKRRIAVEFCSEQSADGLFRKYGVFRVGKRLVAQHVFHHTDWYVKRSTRGQSEGPLHDELMAFIRDNPHAAEVERSFDMARIDYGRIDYTLVAGRLQTFEINTNPAFNPGTPATLLIAERRRHFRDRLYAAFNEIDVPIAGPATVRFELPEPVFQTFPAPATLLTRARRAARRLIPRRR